MLLQIMCLQTFASTTVMSEKYGVMSGAMGHTGFFRNTIEDFKEYQKNKIHPYTVLGLVRPQVSVGDLVADHSRYSSHFKKCSSRQEETAYYIT